MPTVKIPDEKTLSRFRGYFMEVVVLGLTIGVIFLFYLYVDLNNYIRSEFTKTVEKNTIVIENLKQFQK